MDNEVIETDIEDTTTDSTVDSVTEDTVEEPETAGAATQPSYDRDTFIADRCGVMGITVKQFEEYSRGTKLKFPKMYSSSGSKFKMFGMQFIDRMMANPDKLKVVLTTLSLLTMYAKARFVMQSVIRQEKVEAMRHPEDSTEENNNESTEDSSEESNNDQ